MPVKLKEFSVSESARKAEQHNRCKTCTLPPEIRAQVEEGRKNVPPTGWTTISRWLAHEGHSITTPTLKNHFNFGHVK